MGTVACTMRFRDPALLGKIKAAGEGGPPLTRTEQSTMYKAIERDGRSGKLTPEQLHQWHAVQKAPTRVKNQWLLDFGMGKFEAEAAAYEANRQTHAEGLKRTMHYLDEDGLRRLYGDGAWIEGTPQHARVAEIMADTKNRRRNPRAKGGWEWPVYMGTEDFTVSTHTAERGASVAVSLGRDEAQLAAQALAGRGLKRHASEASSAEPKKKAKAKAKATAAAAQEKAAGSTEPGAPTGAKVPEQAKQVKKAKQQALYKANGALPKLTAVKAMVDEVLPQLNPETQVHRHGTLKGISDSIVQVTASLQERRQALERGTIESTDAALKELLTEAEHLITSGKGAVRNALKVTK